MIINLLLGMVNTNTTTTTTNNTTLKIKYQYKFYTLIKCYKLIAICIILLHQIIILRRIINICNSKFNVDLIHKNIINKLIWETRNSNFFKYCIKIAYLMVKIVS